MLLFSTKLDKTPMPRVMVLPAPRLCCRLVVAVVAVDCCCDATDRADGEAEAPVLLAVAATTTRGPNSILGRNRRLTMRGETISR
jgi:hypothetical protein